jgi:hypothetical protein
MKRMFLFFTAALIFAVTASVSFSQQNTTVGGHVRMTLYDYKDGKKVDKTGTVNGHEYSGFDFKDLYLYISSELSDKLTLDVQPMFSTETSATPRLGTEIQKTKKTSAATAPKFNGWNNAVMKMMLPYGYELSAGIMKPRFTWEYGGEMFWEEEYVGGKFAINEFVGLMHETGIEIYKPFEVKNVSLPAYLYVYNGEGNLYSDNNNVPEVMLHAEPEIGAWKFQGSFAAGKWDDKGENNKYRYSAGIAYEWREFSARAEYAGGIWEKSILGKDDAKPFGYYGKLFYSPAQWCKLMLHYDYVEHNFNNFNRSSAGGEKFTTITPGIQLNVASASAIQIQYDIADWKRKDGSQKLEFNRLSVGWRTTF